MVNFYSCGKKRNTNKWTRPKQEHEKIDNEGNEANGKAHYFIFNGVNLDKFHK